MWPFDTLCGFVFPQTHRQRHRESCLGFFLFSFFLCNAKLVFWLECHFPASCVWETKAPATGLAETLWLIMTVGAGGYARAEDWVQLVREKDGLVWKGLFTSLAPGKMCPRSMCSYDDWEGDLLWISNSRRNRNINPIVPPHFCLTAQGYVLPSFLVLMV